MLGSPLHASAPGEGPGDAATHAVLEANVDDATGELAASWIEQLFAAGALDAWVTPIAMKKGRPAMTISALAPLARADAVAHAMLRETTSLGVRRYAVARAERPRAIEQVETPYGRIPVKVADGAVRAPAGEARVRRLRRGRRARTGCPCARCSARPSSPPGRARVAERREPPRSTQARTSPRDFVMIPGARRVPLGAAWPAEGTRATP